MPTAQRSRKPHPLNEQVVVSRIPLPTVSPGGIHVVSRGPSREPFKARVEAVGAGRLLKNGERSPLPVAVGDTVLVDAHGPTEVEIDGLRYLLTRIQDVYAILPEADTDTDD